MNPNQFYYCKKGTPDRDMAKTPLRIKSSKEKPEIVHKENSDISSSYCKQPTMVEVSVVFVVSGGEKRERQYFTMLNDPFVTNLKLVFISERNNGLNPDEMVEVTERAINEGIFHTYDGKICHYEHGDRIYLVSDMDHYKHELLRLGRKHDGRYQWIVSNPAFEIWLYYHKFASPDKDLQDAILMDPLKRSSWLKKRLGELGGFDPRKCFALIQIAISNSKRFYKLENGIPALFSTDMYRLGEELVNIMGNEFEQMLRRREEKAKEYKLSCTHDEFSKQKD